jgi:acyl carrier protein
MKASIRKFVETNFYVPDSAALTDEASLLDSGVIDSTGVLELIGFLQSEFGVEVADDEMIPENLDSIARVEAYVSRKLGGAQKRQQA